MIVHVYIYYEYMNRLLPLVGKVVVWATARQWWADWWVVSQPIESGSWHARMSETAHVETQCNVIAYIQTYIHVHRTWDFPQNWAHYMHMYTCTCKYIHLCTCTYVIVRPRDLQSNTTRHNATHPRQSFFKEKWASSGGTCTVIHAHITTVLSIMNQLCSLTDAFSGHLGLWRFMNPIINLWTCNN